MHLSTFFRAYPSDFFQKLYHYSAYIPATNQKKLPVLIILASQEQEIDDWTEHWRNSVADGLDQIMDLADDIGFIPVDTKILYDLFISRRSYFKRIKPRLLPQSKKN